MLTNWFFFIDNAKYFTFETGRFLKLLRWIELESEYFDRKAVLD